MHITKVKIVGFRNFRDAEINFEKQTLIIGSNDVGKTNLIYALRILLDRGLSDLDAEPSESDFHIKENGKIADEFSIQIFFSNVVEDAVISIFPGKISAHNNMVLAFSASRKDLAYRVLAGRDVGHLEELNSRFYLKHLCLKVVDSRRDLSRFIQTEKKYLLKVAQELRSSTEIDEDNNTLKQLSKNLGKTKNLVDQLHYVNKATDEVNSELQALAHHNASYSVRLNSAALDVNQFVEKLELTGSTYGSAVNIGGDGRNNQILLALWKAKAAREFDHENEVVLYCVEEPEAHLHPHQQRKLARYLNSMAMGQTIVTTHSPQIVSGYSPASIIRLKKTRAGTVAASKGCSSCISDAWDAMGYRMSILPAEAFFASSVMLVEGPSELLLYYELAKQLDIDLDFFNISILSVEGVAFEVYVNILKAMEIPFSLRTDNDISNISLGPAGKKRTMRQLAGLNRCLSLIGAAKLPHKPPPYDASHSLADGTRAAVSAKIEPRGVFISEIDLEHDLSKELQDQFEEYKGSVTATIAHLQDSKAVNMRAFLKRYRADLASLRAGQLAKPLLKSVALAKDEADA